MREVLHSKELKLVNGSAILMTLFCDPEIFTDFEQTQFNESAATYNTETIASFCNVFFRQHILHPTYQFDISVR